MAKLMENEEYMKICFLSLLNTSPVIMFFTCLYTTLNIHYSLMHQLGGGSMCLCYSNYAYLSVCIHVVHCDVKWSAVLKH